MSDRLFVAVIGEPKAGKSTTWNTLFGRKVKTSGLPRLLEINSRESAEVFLVSGSNEERRQYAQKILKNINCRIVLCSVQYTEEAFDRTWSYVFAEGFAIYAQWLNPGHSGAQTWDRLGLANILCSKGAVFSVRDGRAGTRMLNSRIEEIRQFIHGWAAARHLLQ